MMPRTIHNLSALECLSALQKCIRRGMEKEAMEFAVELIHTRKEYCSMVCNRLEIICHEDLDTAAAPHVFPFVAASMALARDRYALPNPGKSRMAIGNAIRMMCRSPKSRIGDHFQAALGWRSLLEGYKPEVPEWALDKHTSAGKKQGRGLDHFRKVGTTLSPPPTEPDPYEEEAFRLWALKSEMEADGRLVDGELAEAPPDRFRAHPTLPGFEIQGKARPAARTG